MGGWMSAVGDCTDVGKDREGERKMNEQANAIVRNHTGWAMAAAFIPLPLVDSAALVGVELDMLRALTKCCGLPWREHVGKQAVGVAVATTVGSTVWGSAAKLIPGAGWAAVGAVQMVIAGTVCYALGKAYHLSLEKGGEFDVEEFRRTFKEYKKEGRKVARELLNDVRAGKYGRPGRRARAVQSVEAPSQTG